MRQSFRDAVALLKQLSEAGYTGTIRVKFDHGGVRAVVEEKHTHLLPQPKEVRQ